MLTNKLKTLSDIESLTNDVEEFFKNPNFSPKRQNKYFFSEGTSYYKQLLEVSRVIKLLQTSLANIYDNQNVLQEEYESLDVTELTGLKTKVEDLETTVNTLLTEVTDVKKSSDTNSQNIASLNNTLTSKTNELNSKIDDNTSKINTNTANITTNKNNITTNTNDIATNKGNIATNKGDIATNKTNINTLSTKVSTAETKVSEMGTKVDSMDAKVTTAVNDVEDVKENYLKDIKIDSTDIQFTDVSKTKGIKEIQASIISSTPADLGTQLTAVKAQNSNLVTSVSDVTINEDTTNKVVNVTQDVTTLENGIPTTDTKNIVSFDTDDFAVDDNGKVSTTVDLQSLADNTNSIMGNYIKKNTTNETTSSFKINCSYGNITHTSLQANSQNPFFTSTDTEYGNSAIFRGHFGCHNRIELFWYNTGISFSIYDTDNKYWRSAKLDGILNHNANTNIALVEDIQPQITNNTNNIASVSTSVQTLEEEYTAQQEVLSDHETLINNNGTNITSLQATTNTLNTNFFNLESRVSTLETSVSNCYTKSETDTAISNAINSAITSVINASY